MQHKQQKQVLTSKSRNQSTNLLRLLAHNQQYLAQWSDRLTSGLQQHRRDCMDMAGKLPLSLKALAIGLDADDLVVDAAQAGGLLGKSDGMLRSASGQFEAVEIKVLNAVSVHYNRAGDDTNTPFVASSPGQQREEAQEEHILIQEHPIRCTDPVEAPLPPRPNSSTRAVAIRHRHRGPHPARIRQPGRLRSRSPIMRPRQVPHKTLTAHKTLVPLNTTETTLDGVKPKYNTQNRRSRPWDAVVTPGSSRSWLGAYISWVSLKDMSRDWWSRVVLRRGVV